MMSKKFENNITIFVYGTLMKGFGNERVISGFPHTNYKATIENVEMYNVGGFPALVEGEHTYQGELVVFDEAVDPEQLYLNMDRLEGYYKEMPSHSMYLRKSITVDVEGLGPVETEVYLWNRPVKGLTYINPDKYSNYREFCENNKRW